MDGPEGASSPDEDRPADRIGLLLVDDDALLREALRLALETEPDLRVVGEAASAEEALRLAQELRPDVVLLDLVMPGDGIAALRALRAALPALRILALTAYVTEQHVRTITDLGVDGCVAKSGSVAEVAAALRSVHAGEPYFHPAVARLLLRRPGTPTGRELDVLRLTAEGLPNGAIAARLGISEPTVRFHLHNLFVKLGARSRTELVRLARERRWIS